MLVGNWESILNSNIIGARNVFEAARENGVKRIAYASRAGVLGDYPQDDPNTFRHTTLPTTPRGDYTISKVFGPSPGSSPLLVPLPAVSWPWVAAWGSLEPPRRDGEDAQKTGKTGEKWARYGLKRVKESGSPAASPTRSSGRH